MLNLLLPQLILPIDASPSLNEDTMTAYAAHALAAVGLDQLLNW